MKKAFYLISIMWSICLFNSLNGQTLITHDFNDGLLDPFYVAKTDQLDRVYVVDEAVETFWDQSLYNGTNSGRKAQFMPINELVWKQELWMGFRLKIHSDYMAENTNTEAGLMQIWGYNDETGSANHMCMLQFDGRNGGALCWQHRYNSVANKTHYLVYENFPRDQFVNIVIHIKLSNYNEGVVQIWVDDVLKLDKSNQTIGWGDMNEDGMYNETYATAASFGQYNYLVDATTSQTYDSDSHLFDGHMEGETRTVTYDDVSLWDGSDGYSIVNPGFDAFSQIEAEDYNDMSGIQTETCSEGGENVGYIDSGDWLKFTDVDFDNGAESFDARVASKNGTGTIELRLGSTSGTLIGSVDVSGTSGWQDWTTVSCDVNGVGGTQDLYLVFSTGGLNINWFEFTESPVSIYIEAEDFSDMSGVNTETTSDSDGGENVGWIDAGDYMDYSVTIPSAGTYSVDYRVASKSGGGSVEFQVDEITKATTSIESTGGWQNWTTLTTSVELSAGTQTIRLYANSGGWNINWFEIYNSSLKSAKVSELGAVADNNINIYPNPFKNIFNIDNAEEATIEIYNKRGILVSSNSILTNSYSIDMSDFPIGLYIVKITNHNVVTYKKIIKQ